MELKYLAILSVLGVVSGFTIPNPNTGANSDLESSFSSGHSSDLENMPREKRGLFKKLKKHDTVYVNRAYESGYEVRPNREVHHHHHYSQYPVQPQQTYEPYHPAPSQEYHHYHGASGYQQGYASQGSTYYGGYSAGYAGGNGYYTKPYYGDGGYAHYGGVGGYSGPPPPPQQPIAPVSTVPIAAGHNQVDRGQGAAAVNNIAIIHARAGSTHNLVESESKILPKPLPVDIEDALNAVTE